MIRLADILFIIGAGLIAFYFVLVLIKPNFIKTKKDTHKLFGLLLPILLIMFAFIGYYIKSNSVQNNNFINNINTNLDSLDQAIKSDTVSFQRIDSLITEIQNNKDKLEQIKKDRELLQKRIRIKKINQLISDSILQQIKSRLENIKIKNTYEKETKVLTSGGKVLMHRGKALVLSEKVYRDIYAIDSIEVYPILKKLDFTTEDKLHSLNYYIDSLKITFKVVRNKGKVQNKGVDSLVFISIYPVKDNYKNYKIFIDNKNQRIAYLDSVYYTDFISNTLTIDFPNVNQNDTIFDFGFFLKRGLIGSFNISFKEPSPPPLLQR